MPVLVKEISQKLPIPKWAKKEWQTNQRVEIDTAPGVLIIKKKISKRQSQEVDKQLKKIGKVISYRDLDQAIKWARSQS